MSNIRASTASYMEGRIFLSVISKQANRRCGHGSSKRVVVFVECVEKRKEKKRRGEGGGVLEL
jgi:hypothetical protein